MTIEKHMRKFVANVTFNRWFDTSDTIDTLSTLC